MLVSGTKIEDLVVDGVSFGPSPAGSTVSAVTVQTGPNPSVIGTLTVKNVCAVGAQIRVAYVLGVGTSVTDLFMNSVRQDGVDYAASRPLAVDTAGSVSRVFMTNVRATNLQHGIGIGVS